MLPNSISFGKKEAYQDSASGFLKKQLVQESKKVWAVYRKINHPHLLSCNHISYRENKIEAGFDLQGLVTLRQVLNRPGFMEPKRLKASIKAVTSAIKYLNELGL